MLIDDEVETCYRCALSVPVSSRDHLDWEVTVDDSGVLTPVCDGCLDPSDHSRVLEDADWGHPALAAGTLSWSARVSGRG